MRDKIFRTCLSIMQRKGLRFTMDDLTRELHISKTTLYKYVRSRDDLIEQFVEYFIEIMDAEELVIYESDASFEEKIIAAVRSYSTQYGRIDNYIYEYLYSNANIAAKMSEFNARRFEHLKAIFAEAEKEGWLTADFNQPLFFKLLQIVQAGLIDSVILSELNMSYSDAVADAVRMSLKGIRASVKED